MSTVLCPKAEEKPITTINKAHEMQKCSSVSFEGSMFAIQHDDEFGITKKLASIHLFSVIFTVQFEAKDVYLMLSASWMCSDGCQQTGPNSAAEKWQQIVQQRRDVERPRHPVLSSHENQSDIGALAAAEPHPKHQNYFTDFNPVKNSNTRSQIQFKS